MTQFKRFKLQLLVLNWLYLISALLWQMKLCVRNEPMDHGLRPKLKITFASMTVWWIPNMKVSSCLRLVLLCQWCVFLQCLLMIPSWFIWSICKPLCSILMDCNEINEGQWFVLTFLHCLISLSWILEVRKRSQMSVEVGHWALHYYKPSNSNQQPVDFWYLVLNVAAIILDLLLQQHIKKIAWFQFCFLRLCFIYHHSLFKESVKG